MRRFRIKKGTILITSLGNMCPLCGHLYKRNINFKRKTKLGKTIKSLNKLYGATKDALSKRST